jgi:hypothetical protein
LKFKTSKKITDPFIVIYRIFLKFMKKNRKMSIHVTSGLNNTRILTNFAKKPLRTSLLGSHVHYYLQMPIGIADSKGAVDQ